MADGKKQAVITDIYKYCSENNKIIFDNETVKEFSKVHGFGNPFDATKLDDSQDLPQILIENDMFIIHLGEGKHRFVKGIEIGYHNFEVIDASNETFDWKYRKSILNELDTSESNILSIASNQRVLHDFLYEDIVASPKIYNSRRTKTNITYKIVNEMIKATNLQIEIDLTAEINGTVTVFEGKNGFPKDFAIYQLFHPYKYYCNIKRENKLPIDTITCCYVLRCRDDQKSVLRLYNYTFTDENEISSIKLLKKAQYTLIKR